ncbi:MAG: metal-dependent hydrolase [Acidimicrobiales bacterium]
MFLWFAGMSFLAVWLIFRSPAVDYRLVMVGAVLPLVELPFGHPRVLHSLAGSVVLLALAMLATPRRRLMQRRLVAIPIGVFLHLVLDGAWTDTTAFWWPFTGWAWSSAELPELSRGAFDVVLEVAGAAALWWAWQRFGLARADRRARFWRTGQLDRDVVAGRP